MPGIEAAKGVAEEGDGVTVRGVEATYEARSCQGEGGEGAAVAGVAEQGGSLGVLALPEVQSGVTWLEQRVDHWEPFGGWITVWGLGRSCVSLDWLSSNARLRTPLCPSCLGPAAYGAMRSTKAKPWRCKAGSEQNPDGCWSAELTWSQRLHSDNIPCVRTKRHEASVESTLGIVTTSSHATWVASIHQTAKRSRLNNVHVRLSGPHTMFVLRLHAW